MTDQDRSGEVAPSVEGDILGHRRALLTAGLIPHDPLKGSNDCPECGTPFPCANRIEQRRDHKAIVAYLTADLYRRVEPLPNDPPGARFTSPLGWSVWITYGFDTLVGTVRRPDGSPHAANTHATVEWLEEVLP